jgi:hypothetical protein
MITNVYVTLEEYKGWPDIESTDSVDDAVISYIIGASCRYIESKTWRTFYPRVETHLYDIPSTNDIRLDDDLLEVLSFLNGDGVAITSADYILESANFYPKWKLKLRDISNVIWAYGTSYTAEQALSLNAIWGFHERYSTRAWVPVGTLGAAIANTTVLNATLTAGHTAITGQIWRIDNELFNGTVTANTMSFQKRGDNGSTAIAHLINAPVYAWSVQDEIKEAAVMLIASLEKRRAGESISSDTIATAAGVLITPRDVPGFVSDVISSYKKLS